MLDEIPVKIKALVCLRLKPFALRACFIFAAIQDSEFVRHYRASLLCITATVTINSSNSRAAV